MQYKLIDHTADFGLHVFGRDVQDLFVNAAHALYGCRGFGGQARI